MYLEVCYPAKELEDKEEEEDKKEDEEDASDKFLMLIQQSQVFHYRQSYCQMNTNNTILPPLSFPSTSSVLLPIYKIPPGVRLCVAP